MILSVEGVDVLLRELKAFNKDAERILLREVREGMDKIRDDAQASVPQVILRGTRRDGGSPSKGWGAWVQTKGRNFSVGVVTGATRERDLSWNQSKVRAGIKRKAASTKARGGDLYYVYGSVENTTAQGAIFALAGRGPRGHQQFGSDITSRFGGTYPRMLGPAWTKNVENVREQIRAAITRAAETVAR